MAVVAHLEIIYSKTKPKLVLFFWNIIKMINTMHDETKQYLIDITS